MPSHRPSIPGVERVQVSFRIRKDLLKQLGHMAVEVDLNRSDVLERIIENHLLNWPDPKGDRD